MSPLSYQGFGFTAIVLMVAILAVNQIVKYIWRLKDRYAKRGSAREKLIYIDEITKE